MGDGDTERSEINATSLALPATRTLYVLFSMTFLLFFTRLLVCSEWITGSKLSRLYLFLNSEFDATTTVEPMYSKHLFSFYQLKNQIKKVRGEIISKIVLSAVIRHCFCPRLS